MAIGAIVAGAAIVGGSLLKGSAAKKAAKQQGEAAAAQRLLSKRIFQKTERNAAPFLEGGTDALEALLSELGLGEAPTIDGEKFAGFQESPGFKFAFQKGVDAVDASAAAGGGLFSGSTLEDLTKFGQGFASQARGTFLNRLQSLVSVGQTAVGQVAGAGTVFNQFGSQAIAAGGNARSAGTIGQANAFSEGLNSLATVAGGAFGGFGGGSGFGFGSAAPSSFGTVPFGGS